MEYLGHVVNTKQEFIELANNLEEIVKTILKEIGQVTALEFAAIIGLSFDLACVSNAMELNLDEIIFQFEQANVKGLIVKKENDYDYEFVDELIRKIICDSYRVLLHDYDWDTEFIEIMKYRSTLLNQFIQQKKKFTSKSLFNCFNNIDIHLSSVWKFLGKGIIFSELMYYRE